jgi:hypothetical protein
MIILEGESISVFFYLQVYHKLRMEVRNPNGPTWRGSMMNQAKAIMDKHGVVCRHRTKAKVFAQYEQFLREGGVL